MAEYSRLATGMVTSTGGNTAVVLPFIPDFIEIYNSTRATAASGVTRAWWTSNMGEGAAFLTTTGAGPADGTSFVTATTGTGFSTFRAALALQYGPTVLLGASGGITKNAGAPVITTTAAHGLVPGNVVVFSNLYETTTTGMQQIAGIPFVVVTVPSTTTFTINWDTSGTNYTAIATGGLNTNASFKKVLYPFLYAPSATYISGLAAGSGVFSNATVVTTTAPHNFKIGQEVGFHIPAIWGPVQLNELPNLVRPGSPIYHYVRAVTETTFTIDVVFSTLTAYVANQPFGSFIGQKFPVVVPAGDVNTGGDQIFANSVLYPSPQLYNGFSNALTSTINGPAIQGAFVNNTLMGFVIGAAAAGTAADTIYWRAQMSDIVLPVTQYR